MRSLFIDPVTIWWSTGCLTAKFV